MNPTRRASYLRSLPLLFALTIAALDAHAQSSYTNFESPQTNPLRLSPDGSRLFAANTAGGRVAVFSLLDPSAPALIAEIPVGLEPVSVWPVSGDEVWVVNHVSDSVSVVSVLRGIVTDTLAAGDEPCDIVVAGAPPRAYVSAARSKQVRVFDLATHALVATIPLLGEHPRALAVNADGTKVYAAFALSGNGTTIWPRNATPRPPAPPAPTNPLLPAAPRTGLIIDQSNPNYPTVILATLLDHDIAEISTASNAVVRYFDAVGTINLGLAISPLTGDLFVVNTEARNRVFYLENIRGYVVDNRLTRVTTGASPVVTAFDLNPGLNYGVLPNTNALGTALAQPAGVVFDPSGDFLWLAAFGTDRIAKVDTNGVVLARIEIGNTPAALTDPQNKRGPRGLALKPEAGRLYVQNRLANTLTVINTSDNTVLGEIPVGSVDPTPLEVKRGRGYFYDAKLSGNGIASCASCHVDGATDNLAWDLGDRAASMVTVTDPISGTNYSLHPMKGPLVTQTMAGLDNFDPYHWRGDMPNLEAFNINFDILLGAPQLSAADMAHLVAFLKSIRHTPNPHQNLDRSLPTNLNGGDANVGLTLFQQAPSPTGDAESCASCHSLPTLTFRREIIPAEGNGIAFARKVPTLRQVYKKNGFNLTAGTTNTMGFGQTCDGAVASRAGGTGPNALAFIAFQQAWDTGTAPAVGYTRTIRADNVSTGAVSSDWSTLEARATVGDNDLVVNGEVDGAVHCLAYSATDGLYHNDTPGNGPFTRAELVAQAEAGATFTIMGTPPDSNACATLAVCPPVPLDTCFASGKSRVHFKGNSNSSKRMFSWKWDKGTSPLGQADFGDPVAGATAYTLCVYDDINGVAALKMSVVVSPAGMCRDRDCWKAAGDKGWTYKNKDGNTTGVTVVRVKGGDAGKPQIQLKAKGVALPMPAAPSATAFFDQDPAVIVQLHSSSPPSCWANDYRGANTTKNDGAQFKAKTP